MRMWLIAFLFLFSCSICGNQNPSKTQKFLTKVIVLDKINSSLYPKLHEDFLRALVIWSELVPVHFIVTYDNRVAGVPIIFADLQAEPYKNPKDFLGVYYRGQEEKLIIDSDLENDSQTGYYGSIRINVSLHELGHMMGMGHVVADNYIFHNTLQVGNLFEARKYIMFPDVTAGSDQRIQDDEVKFLRELLLFSPEICNNIGKVTFFTPEPYDASSGQPQDSFK